MTVWNARTKAAEKDKTIADIVVGAKSLSEAWKILKRMIDEISARGQRAVQENL